MQHLRIVDPVLSLQKAAARIAELFFSPATHSLVCTAVDPMRRVHTFLMAPRERSKNFQRGRGTSAEILIGTASLLYPKIKSYSSSKETTILFGENCFAKRDTFVKR
jgi:hypothetical protein